MALLKYPESMYYTRIIFPQHLLKKVIDVLQEVGVLHVSKARELRPIELSELEERFEKVKKIKEALTKLQSFITETTIVRVKEKINVDELENLLFEVDKKTQELLTSLESLSIELARLDNTISSLRQLLKYSKRIFDYLGDIEISIINREGRFIIKTISAAKDLHKILAKTVPEASIASVIPYDGEELIIIIVPSELKDKLYTAIKELKMTVIDFSKYRDLKLSSMIKRLESDLQELENKRSLYISKIKEIITANKEFIAFAKIVIDNEYDRLSMLLMAAKSRLAYMVSGWTPESLKHKLRYAVETRMPQVLLLFEETPSRIPHSKPLESSFEEEPPTKLKNSKIVRPFEVLTKLYGIPRYNEWDPTSLIAYVFPIFFGLMLGDVFYGIALLAITYFLLDKFVENPESEDYRKLKNILRVSAIASIIAGALAGNFLGDLIKNLTGIDFTIIRELRNPITFITIAMIIGLIHVNLAHLLALIRAITYRAKWEIVSKTGLFIAELFGIPFVLYTFIRLKILPIPDDYYQLLLYGALAGVALIAVATVKLMGMFGGIMWLFELTGLLGDVMSYARIAGVGLATSYLAQSFNMMASSVVSGIEGILPGVIGFALGTLLSIPVLFIGHLLNLALSSLGAFIHSLRLFFVEFLPKFYEGGGLEYKPFKIRIEKVVMLGPVT